MADKAISKAPIRRLMKSQGAYLVAEDAVISLISYLENYAKELTKKAIEIVEAQKKKKVTADDIYEAAKAL